MAPIAPGIKDKCECLPSTLEIDSWERQGIQVIVQVHDERDIVVSERDGDSVFFTHVCVCCFLVSATKMVGLNEMYIRGKIICRFRSRFFSVP